MKTYFKYIGLLGLILSFGSLFGQAQKSSKLETITFHVEGVCNMCKSRIETASYDVSGVKSAKWDKETGILTAVILRKKTTRQKVADAVAAVGYANELAEANKEAYQKLPMCCQYDNGAESPEKH